MGQNAGTDKTRRGGPTYAESIRLGLRSGLIVATFFSLVVTVQRLLLGPNAFARLGMTWAAIVALYYVAFCLGGCAYGALLPLKPKNLLAAMMSGVLLVLPVYLGFGVFIGLALNKAPTLGVALTAGAVAAVLVGIPVGLRDFGSEREGEGNGR